MITKDTIVTRDNIKDIKTYLFEDLYNNYDSKFDLEYLDIENLDNVYIRKERRGRIHANIMHFLPSMTTKYVVDNFKLQFNSWNIIFIINKKYYKTIINKVYDKNRLKKDYHIRYVECIPENLIGAVSTGVNVGSMGFGRIITEKEKNIIDIIK
jgi:hypothetical protein